MADATLKNNRIEACDVEMEGCLLPPRSKPHIEMTRGGLGKSWQVAQISRSILRSPLLLYSHTIARSHTFVIFLATCSVTYHCPHPIMLGEHSHLSTLLCNPGLALLFFFGSLFPPIPPILLQIARQFLKQFSISPSNTYTVCRIRKHSKSEPSDFRLC